MARYHVNPDTQKPGRCDAKPDGCCRFQPKDGPEPPHYGSRAEAQVAVEKSLAQEHGDSVLRGRQRPGARVEPEDWGDSQCRDGSGALLTVSHGSDVDFGSFDSSFTGRGNDAYGSGFYFTTDQETASTYGAHLKQVHLNVKNPLVVDGREAMSLNDVRLTPEVVSRILRSVPHIYEQSDSDEMNPMGDYVEEFWDRDDWSKPEMEAMMDRMAREHFSDAYFPQVESLFGDGENSAVFRQSLSEATGWDGVRVDFDGSSHWIAWFPEQIQVVE